MVYNSPEKGFTNPNQNMKSHCLDRITGQPLWDHLLVSKELDCSVRKLWNLQCDVGAFRKLKTPVLEPVPMHPWEEWDPIADMQQCKKPMGYCPSNGTLRQDAALILESVSIAWERETRGAWWGQIEWTAAQEWWPKREDRTRETEKREWQVSRMSPQSQIWRGSGAYRCSVWNLSTHVHPKAAGKD